MSEKSDTDDTLDQLPRTTWPLTFHAKDGETYCWSGFINSRESTVLKVDLEHPGNYPYAEFDLVNEQVFESTEVDSAGLENWGSELRASKSAWGPKAKELLDKVEPSMDPVVATKYPWPLNKIVERLDRTQFSVRWRTGLKMRDLFLKLGLVVHHPTWQRAWISWTQKGDHEVTIKFQPGSQNLRGCQVETKAPLNPTYFKVESNLCREKHSCVYCDGTGVDPRNKFNPGGLTEVCRVCNGERKKD